MFIRVKKGSHAQGVGNDLRIFKAKDPTNNIFESHEPLHELDPGKFEKYEGPLRPRGLVPGEAADREMRGQRDLPAPPLPPDEFGVPARPRALTPDQARQRAEALKREAEELLEVAENTERAQIKQQQEDDKRRKNMEKVQKQAEAARREDTRAAEKATTGENASRHHTDEHEGEEGDGLEEMTVAELRDKAAKEEIELTGAQRKDEIIQTIREGRKAKG